MKKIRAAVVGYGNIGHFALEALEAAPDFEVAGVVRRDPSKRESIPTDIPVVADIRELNDVDVAILATPTRKVEEYAREILALGINTVDSFDIHSQIPQLHRSLGKVAEENGKVAVISAGWDPGSDSVVRTLLEAEGADIYQLRSRYEYGTHCGCQGHRRRESRAFDDDSDRNRNPSPYGVCGTPSGI